MRRGGRSRATRMGVAAVLFVFAAAPGFWGSAAGEESLTGMQARMDAIQAELDAAAARISELEGQTHKVEHRIEQIEERVALLERRAKALQKKAIERADALYRAGGVGMVELLFEAENFSDLTQRAEMLSAVSQEDQGVFIELYRNKEELQALDKELTERERELADTLDTMEEESARLQSKFEAVTREYNSLKARLAAAQERSVPTGGAVSQLAPPPAPSRPRVVRVSGNMTCPVAGPVSFVDSWGAPRAGHTHQGVDMMAAYGTPVVAIVSGTITYAAYDGSGGNMIFLSGDDGHQYWYMHNQANLVSSGHVSVGEQIATVGDTGNAEGTPHVHFEYHPGGGGPVNPYPLVASIC